MDKNFDFTLEFKAQASLRMGECLDKIRKCLEMLDDANFWYRPNPSSNSVGHLLLHLSGNIRQYILSGLGGADDTRQREKEFLYPADNGRTEIEGDFFETAETARKLIENLSDGALGKQKTVQGFQLTGLGIVLHVVEHLSYHTGQIAYLTKLKTDTDLGFYRGIDLNATNN
jgi:uncharacterized damage-inducible protein DinB